MNGPIRRIALAVFLGFGVLLVFLTWFQVVAADTYRSDPRNVRGAITLSTKERGLIVTADGKVVARSDPQPGSPQAFQRTYPGGEAYTPVVGYVSRLVGADGLEAAYSDLLRSRRDLTISDVLAALLGRDLRPLNLQITIDSRVQEAAYRALAGQRGAVVAIEPSTGAILAYVSSPSFDPSLLLGTDAVQRRQEMLDAPDQPLLDRAAGELYPPGSTFKTVVAAAALESGLAGPESELPDSREYRLPGSTATISNFDGQMCGRGGTVTLQDAFVRSCNTVFAALAVEVGADEIDRVATAFGFNRTFEFPWEVAESVFPRRELVDDPAALAQSGIGQRDVKATPLQMAMVAAAIANRGELMEPRLVWKVFNADGDTVDQPPSRSLGRAVSPAAAAVLGQMMERVVTEGTGRRGAVPGIRVAGKTGTAEQPNRPPHAWFIGFAPVEQPTIAVAVLVESGGNVGETATGGLVAAPIAAQVIAAYLTS